MVKLVVDIFGDQWLSLSEEVALGELYSPIDTLEDSSSRYLNKLP